MTPQQAKSVGNMSFEVTAAEGKANGSIDYDFQANQATYETSGNLSMDFNLEATDPMMASMNTSGNMSLDLITLKDKVLFKLNSLNVSGADTNPQLGMVTAMTAPFQNNWYFVENAATNPMMELQQELLTKQKEVIALMKKHTLLSHVSTNENAEYYDYEVQLNQEGVINFMKDLETLGQTEENTQTLLTQTEIDDIKAGVAEFNKEIKGNIKIDKTNLEYFTLTFSHEDGSIVIENTKENFNITMNDTMEKMSIAFLGTKSKTKFDAVITVVAEKSENETINLVDGTMSVETDGKKSNMSLALKVKDEYSDEELNINFSLSDETTETQVKIEEPADAKNFEEVIAQMMGGMMGAPVPMDAQYDEMNMNDDMMDLNIQNGNVDLQMDDMNINVEGENVEVNVDGMNIDVSEGNVNINVE